jgi:hypothetical protein
MKTTDLNIYEKEHPHHLVWKEHTESLLAGNPKTVQWKMPRDDKWETSTDRDYNFSWLSSWNYRIAPEMTTLKILDREVTFPKPFSGLLGKSQPYYIVDSNGISRRFNANLYLGALHVSQGIVHLSNESAIDHLAAIEIIKL